jgi:hypothetical protein
VFTGGLSDLFGGFFAEGGIITAPRLIGVGEAGPEAVLPLDRLSDFLGGRGGSQTIIIQLDGRELSRSVVRHMPSVVRLQLGPAV